MGSIGEEELVQMVRDYIESGSTPSITVNHLMSLNPPSKKPLSTLQDILSEATGLETQVLEKVLIYAGNYQGEPSSLKKWMVKRLQMDGFEASLCKTSRVFEASLCKTSWVSTFHPEVLEFSGDYEFIEVVILDKKAEKLTRLIVDMDLKSQFELARPTQAYKELANSLPPVFVGTEERLKKTISILCSAAKQSLKEKGLHVPPWRKAKYMQSKWLSKNCKKVSV